MADSSIIGAIFCGVIWCILFITCSLLLSKSLRNYCKIKKKPQATSKGQYGLSLITMSLYTLSLFLYVVHSIVFVAGNEAKTLNLLSNVCYLIAIFIGVYVWMQRLDSTFQHSSHGYSPKYIQNLRRSYVVTVVLGMLLLVQHAVVLALDATTIGTIVGGAIWALSFISLFIAVLYSFLHKMKQSVKLARQVSQSTVNQTNMIGNKLVQLVVKFTILAVLCVGSTLVVLVFLCVVLAVSPGWPWYWMQLALSIDAFLGFMSLYCAWTVNKHMYRKVFGCVHSAIIQHREESSITSQDHDVTTREVAPSVLSVASKSKLSDLDAHPPADTTTVSP
eukprot:54699_1